VDWRRECPAEAGLYDERLVDAVRKGGCRRVITVPFSSPTPPHPWPLSPKGERGLISTALAPLGERVVPPCGTG